MPLHPRLAAEGSMTNSPPPDPEIRLSVSDSGDVEPTDGPPKERRPLRAILFGSRRRTTIILSTAFIVVLAVAIGVYTYDRSEKEAPVEALESFLQAVHDQDIDAIDRHLARPMSAEDMDVIEEAEVLSSDWEIGALRLVSLNRLGDNQSATVSAEIIGPDDTSVTDEFTMSNTEDQWIVGHPYTSVEMGADSIPYVEVNSVVPEAGERIRSSTTLHFLPGVYEFGSALDWVDPMPGAIVLLGDQWAATERDASSDPADEASMPMSLYRHFDISTDSQEEVQNRVNNYLDECIVDSVTNLGCPVSLSAQDVRVAVGDDSTYEFDESSAEWTISHYPEVEAIYNGGSVNSPMLELANLTPGEAELTIDATGDAGTETLILHCNIGVELLEPTLAYNGLVYIGPLEDVRDRPDESQDVSDMDCQLAE